eukprot:COSAG03_NODE_3638_length_1905_cov_2.049834_2_plen_164_part_00
MRGERDTERDRDRERQRQRERERERERETERDRERETSCARTAHEIVQWHIHLRGGALSLSSRPLLQPRVEKTRETKSDHFIQALETTPRCRTLPDTHISTQLQLQRRGAQDRMRQSCSDPNAPSPQGARARSQLLLIVVVFQVCVADLCYARVEKPYKSKPV